MNELIKKIAKTNTECPHFIVEAVREHHKLTLNAQNELVPSTVELWEGDELFRDQTKTYTEQALYFFKESAKLIERKIKKGKKITSFPYAMQLSILENLIKDEEKTIEEYMNN